jgi:hypothetical protein
MTRRHMDAGLESGMTGAVIVFCSKSGVPRLLTIFFVFCPMVAQRDRTVLVGCKVMRPVGHDLVGLY